MSITRSNWVAKHTLGEHLEIPSRLLGVVEDGDGDRLGNAPGPHNLKLLGDTANDWHKARVNVTEGKCQALVYRSSDSTADRRVSTKAVTHGLHNFRGLGSVTARRARATGAKADEAVA